VVVRGLLPRDLCDRANTAFEAEVKLFGGFIYRQASDNPERHAGAGRFFVYPKSHLIDMAKNGGDFDIAFHHDRYKELVKRVITEPGLFFRGASPEQRDVLFWAAKTISWQPPHGEADALSTFLYRPFHPRSEPLPAVSEQH
jgi:hypothetical protein